MSTSWAQKPQFIIQSTFWATFYVHSLGLGAVRESKMHKTWHFPPGTHWKGEAGRRLWENGKYNTYKMLRQGYTNELYHQSAD